MPTEIIELSDFFPASPQKLYSAWLDGIQHARMTGGGATGEPKVGAPHTAWDGYISGENLALEKDRRIVQSWMTTEFPEGAAPSRLQIDLKPEKGGTRLTLRHSDLPEGDADRYREGWLEHYFQPMKQFFKAATRKKPAAKKKKATRPAKKAKKAAPKRTAARRAAPKRKSR